MLNYENVAVKTADSDFYYSSLYPDFNMNLKFRNEVY